MMLVGLMAAVSLLDTPLSLTNPFVFIQLQRGDDICAYLKGGTTLFTVWYAVPHLLSCSSVLAAVCRAALQVPVYRYSLLGQASGWVVCDQGRVAVPNSGVSDDEGERALLQSRCAVVAGLAAAGSAGLWRAAILASLVPFVLPNVIR